MFRPRAFTLIELLVVISIIALLIGILLPALGAARLNARQMQSSTQVRGIIQGMINYAPNNHNLYPGLAKNSNFGMEDKSPLAPTADGYGTTVGTGFHPAYRYAILLRGTYFAPEYAVSPAEIDRKILPASLTSTVPGNVEVKNYSYAMLELSSGYLRNLEWATTSNGKAAVVADRNIGSFYTPNKVRSIYTSAEGEWRGAVGYNDNHVVFETTNVIPNLQYGFGNAPVAAPGDNIFETGDILTDGVPPTVDADCTMAYQIVKRGYNHNP